MTPRFDSKFGKNIAEHCFLLIGEGIGHYEAFDVLQTLERAAMGAEQKVDFIELIAQVQAQPESFKNILIELLEGVFYQHKILLVLDDLEQHILEELSGERKEAEVKPEYQSPLTAIIEAFAGADTESCLLLTSRYKFSLKNRYGDNVSGSLKAINVPDMTETELEMHWLALQQTVQKEQQDNSQSSIYLQRIFAASRGNPGLQHVLFQPLLKGEVAALDRALERITTYQAGLSSCDGSTPDDLDKYLRRIALEVYSKALSDTELQLLRLLTLFDFPVPEELLLQAGPKVGIDDPAAALSRLDNFGLLNHWQGKDLEGHISCYGVARKVVEPLGKEDRNYLAQICAPLLWHIWFKDFLAEYAVPETETLRGSVEFIIAKHFSRDYQGQLPLSDETDQRRIAALHQLCIQNSLAAWEKTSFDVDTFISYLELSLVLNVFIKLSVSGAALEKLSTVQFENLYTFFNEERKEVQEYANEHSQEVINLMFERFAGRGELLRKVYLLLFGELDKTTEDILKKADFGNEENRLKTAVQLARTDSERADAYEAAGAMYERAFPKFSNNLGNNYARFLKNQKQAYESAEAMYLRALAADPYHPNTLGRYAIFLFDKKQAYEEAESIYERALDADSNNACTLGSYAIFLFGKKQAYEAAEAMYEQALDVAPNDPNTLGNYTIFLFDKKQAYEAAKVMYKRALALKKILLDGVRSIGWNLEDNVHRAEQDGHPHIALLTALAKVISDDEPIETLDQFPQWSEPNE